MTSLKCDPPVVVGAVENVFLASKLRQIKCKLDETSSSSTAPIAPPLQQQPAEAATVSSSSPSSSSASSSSSSSSVGNHHHHRHQPAMIYHHQQHQQPPPLPPLPPQVNPSTSSASNHKNLHLHQFNSTKHFQFELDTSNHSTSFDHLFDQFKHDLSANHHHHSSKLKQTAPPPPPSAPPSSNDHINMLNSLRAHNNNVNLYDHHHSPSRGVSLKNVEYSENVSRQSSIRSLVNAAASNPAAVAAVNHRLNKILAAKSVTASNNTNSGDVMSVAEKHEYDLIADWDLYNPASSLSNR